MDCYNIKRCQLGVKKNDSIIITYKPHINKSPMQRYEKNKNS